ncbi:hypothetical protein [Candidatus Kryptobacter tengchongensis]|uniref:hypothetical protein n=1 Tax=Kryptobacter tengchongensis TaxID=1643429 RepID=UPI0013520A4A|nr:hypothetical protein [Candidatus Kryptobacter tengchongensis]
MKDKEKGNTYTPNAQAIKNSTLNLYKDAPSSCEKIDKFKSTERKFNLKRCS